MKKAASKKPGKVAAPLPTKIKKPVKEQKEVISTEIVVASIEERAEDHFTKLNKFEGGKIKTQAEFDLIAENVKALKAIDKIAKDEEDSFLEPIALLEKKVKEHFKPFHDKVKKWDTSAKLMMSIFLEANKKRIEKITSDFEEGRGRVKSVGTFTTMINKLQPTKGAAKIRKLKKVVVVNPKKVPVEFLSPDLDKIEEALKRGETVPGCEYQEVNSIAI